MGIKKLRLKTIIPCQTWRKDLQSGAYFSEQRHSMDPHERRSVYVGISRIPNAGEGLFARQDFKHGDLVSYFGGQRTFSWKFLFKNMSTNEREYAASIQIDMGAISPKNWGIDENLVIDIPLPYRSIVDYRTTLGHKANNGFSLFGDTNTEFKAVIHPFLGKIACLIAGMYISA